jgi:hypothetical protein
MRCCCRRRNGCGAKMIEYIKMISIGKFATKLYYNGKGFKGSLATGILTIILSISLAIYAIYIFADIYYR